MNQRYFDADAPGTVPIPFLHKYQPATVAGQNRRELQIGEKNHSELQRREEQERSARDSMICYCVNCVEKITNIGEPHACQIECYGCYALLHYIGEPHNCPVKISDNEDDEGFENQLGFVYDKLKELAAQILAGEDIVLVRFKNGEWLSVAVPRNIVDELQQEAI